MKSWGQSPPQHDLKRSNIISKRRRSRNCNLYLVSRTDLNNPGQEQPGVIFLSIIYKKREIPLFSIPILLNKIWNSTYECFFCDKTFFRFVRSQWRKTENYVISPPENTCHSCNEWVFVTFLSHPALLLFKRFTSPLLWKRLFHIFGTFLFQVQLQCKCTAYRYTCVDCHSSVVTWFLSQSAFSSVCGRNLLRMTFLFVEMIV